jgi:hypothetical protein
VIAVFVVYLALTAVDIGRGLAVAALNYSLAGRFQAVAVNPSKGMVVVFDSATGETTARPLPEALRPEVQE